MTRPKRNTHIYESVLKKSSRTTTEIIPISHNVDCVIGKVKKKNMKDVCEQLEDFFFISSSFIGTYFIGSKRPEKRVETKGRLKTRLKVDSKILSQSGQKGFRRKRSFKRVPETQNMYF